MPSTFTHGVVPASCLALTSKKNQPIPKGQLFRLAAIGFILGNSPDLDIIPATLLGDSAHEIHRCWGHNIFSLFIYIFMGTVLFKTFVKEQYRPKRLLFTSALLVLSHIVFDAMGEESIEGFRRGIPLLWPLSNWELLLPFKIFKSYTVDHNLPLLWAHIVSAQFWTRAVFTEVVFTALFIPTWLAFYAVGRRMKNRTKKLAEETTPEVKIAS